MAADTQSRPTAGHPCRVWPLPARGAGIDRLAAGHYLPNLKQGVTGRRSWHLPVRDKTVLRHGSGHHLGGNPIIRPVRPECQDRTKTNIIIEESLGIVGRNSDLATSSWESVGRIR